MSTESPCDPASRRHSWRWIGLILFVVLVAADQGFRALERLRVNAEIQALRKQGYPVGAAELQAWYSSVPDQENAALRILEAADYMAVGPETFSKWPAPAEELGPQEKDWLERVLTNNAPALETVHQAVQLKHSHFSIDFSRGPGALLPHLAKFRPLANLLRAQAMWDADVGQPEAAVKSVVDGLALARALDTEPTLISQLVRIACLASSCASLERVLNQQQLTEAQLAVLAKAVSETREASPQAFANGYLGEVSLGIYCFQAPQAELLTFLNSDGDAAVAPKLLLPLYTLSGLRDRDCLHYLRMMHRNLDLAKMPFPDRLARAKEAAVVDDHELQAHKLLIFSRMLLPALRRTNDKAAESDARLRCAEAALAVERYRVRHQGTVPDDLKAVAQAFSGQLPMDPIDGAPLRFKKLPVGYAVYSIGIDGVDNGGVREQPGKPGVGKRANGFSGDRANAFSGNSRPIGLDIVFSVQR